MCPAGIASAALVAGSVTTTGGVTAFVVNLIRKKNISKNANRKEK